MGVKSVTLVAVNCADIASLDQAKALLSLDDWATGPVVDGCATFAWRDVRMLHLPDGLLFEDHLDQRWYNSTGETVREVIFPSRHVAASGQASLTLHPIGVPHLLKGETGRFGGQGGLAPPPSPRLGPWWRMLLERAPRTPGLEGFDLSLEVTHHGPLLSVPSLFIEVGSCERTWGHEGAASLLAGIIRDGLASQEADSTWDIERHAGDLVVITLGGGHYAPRANLLAQLPGVWLGHMLATYALPFESSDDPSRGTWAQSIDAAVVGTQSAFPGGEIVCSMDKKAFKGWQRQAIKEHLSSLNIPIMTSKEIRARVEEVTE